MKPARKKKKVIQLNDTLRLIEKQGDTHIFEITCPNFFYKKTNKITRITTNLDLRTYTDPTKNFSIDFYIAAIKNDDWINSDFYEINDTDNDISVSWKVKKDVTEIKKDFVAIKKDFKEIRPPKQSNTEDTYNTKINPPKHNNTTDTLHKQTTPKKPTNSSVYEDQPSILQKQITDLLQRVAAIESCNNDNVITKTDIMKHQIKFETKTDMLLVQLSTQNFHFMNEIKQLKEQIQQQSTPKTYTESKDSTYMHDDSHVKQKPTKSNNNKPQTRWTCKGLIKTSIYCSAKKIKLLNVEIVDNENINFYKIVAIKNGQKKIIIAQTKCQIIGNSVLHFYFPKGHKNLSEWNINDKDNNIYQFVTKKPSVEN